MSAVPVADPRVGRARAAVAAAGLGAAGIGAATPTSTTDDACAPTAAASDVDRGATGHEVRDHLGRDVGRVGRDALRRRRGRRPRRRSPADDGRVRPAGDAGQLDHELLEAAQAAGRLRQPIEVAAAPPPSRPSSSGPTASIAASIAGSVASALTLSRPLSVSGRPATTSVDLVGLRPRTAGGPARRGRGRRASPACIGTMPEPDLVADDDDRPGSRAIASRASATGPSRIGSGSTGSSPTSALSHSVRPSTRTGSRRSVRSIAPARSRPDVDRRPVGRPCADGGRSGRPARDPRAGRREDPGPARRPRARACSARPKRLLPLRVPPRTSDERADAHRDAATAAATRIAGEGELDARAEPVPVELAAHRTTPGADGEARPRARASGRRAERPTDESGQHDADDRRRATSATAAATPVEPRPANQPPQPAARPAGARPDEHRPAGRETPRDATIAGHDRMPRPPRVAATSARARPRPARATRSDRDDAAAPDRWVLPGSLRPSPSRRDERVGRVGEPVEVEAARGARSPIARSPRAGRRAGHRTAIATTAPRSRADAAERGRSRPRSAPNGRTAPGSERRRAELGQRGRGPGRRRVEDVATAGPSGRARHRRGVRQPDDRGIDAEHLPDPRRRQDLGRRAVGDDPARRRGARAGGRTPRPARGRGARRRSSSRRAR